LGLAKLQVIKRDIHVVKCAAEARDRRVACSFPRQTLAEPNPEPFKASKASPTLRGQTTILLGKESHGQVSCSES
jgi:hypothetical protein